MHLTGGFTNYGQDIGILMLDTIFPRIPGDIGNAGSYNIPVRYKTVKNAKPFTIMGDKPDAELLKPFVEAARELEAEGVKAITTSCGFLAAFQGELADAVKIPVFTSALILAPLVRSPRTLIQSPSQQRPAYCWQRLFFVWQSVVEHLHGQLDVPEVGK